MQDIRSFFSGAVSAKATGVKKPAPASQKPSADNCQSKSLASRNTRTRQLSPLKRKQPVAVVDVDESPKKQSVNTTCASSDAANVPVTKKLGATHVALDKSKKSVALASPRKSEALPKSPLAASPRRVPAKSAEDSTATRKSPRKKPVVAVTIVDNCDSSKDITVAAKGVTSSKTNKKSEPCADESHSKDVNEVAIPPRSKRRRVKVLASDDEEETVDTFKAAGKYKKAAQAANDAGKSSNKEPAAARSTGRRDATDDSDDSRSTRKVKTTKRNAAAAAPVVVSDSGEDSQEPARPEPRNTLTAFLHAPAAVKTSARASSQSAVRPGAADAAVTRKETSASDFFGSAPVQHVKRSSGIQKPSAASAEWDDADGHDDADFQMVLQQIDQEESLKKAEVSADSREASSPCKAGTPASTLAKRLKDLTSMRPLATVAGESTGTPVTAEAGSIAVAASTSASPSQATRAPKGPGATVEQVDSPTKLVSTGSGAALATTLSPSRARRSTSQQTPRKDVSMATVHQPRNMIDSLVVPGGNSPAARSLDAAATASGKRGVGSPKKSPAVKRASLSAGEVTPPKKARPPSSSGMVLDSRSVGHQTSPAEASMAVGTPEAPAGRRDAARVSKNGNLESPTAAEADHDGSSKVSSKGSAYRAYLARPQAPRAPGSKEIPEGNENCFEGLTFVLTGVLESLGRDEAKELIEKYGGKVTTNVSKKTSYMVEGEEAGEAKLQKAKQLGTAVLTEDGLLDLLRKLPGKKSKFVAAAEQEAAKEASSKKAPVSSIPAKVNSPSSALAGNLSSDQKGNVTLSPTVATGGQPSRQPAPPADTSSLMWVDKYKPKKSKDLIGQQGDRSNAKKLLAWLKSWHANRAAGVKPVSNFGRFGGGANDTGAGFRAALLSGPPGIGKTTTAQIVCQEAGFTYFELNASDTRSRLSLQAELSAALGSQSMAAYAMLPAVGRADAAAGSSAGHADGAEAAAGRAHCVLMDEVDGMAGNEDRGGLQELVALIKTTHVPIICMCNDRSSPKMRTLSNYCFDLRFQRPRVDQIKAAMMSIAFKEGLKVEPAALNDIIQASNQDIRQVIHNLSMCTAASRSLTYEQGRKSAAAAKKDTVLGPFDVCMKVFSDEYASASLPDKSDLFFYDYNIAPLFVQENYPSSHPSRARDLHSHLRFLAKAADNIADGDVVSNMIRRNQNWNLLPVQAVFSSVLPGEAMRGRISKMVDFPKWLGRNSSRGKFDRLVRELHFHARLAVSADRTDMSSDYLPALRGALTTPLMDDACESAGAGVEQVLATMEEYSLQREDYDNILEMTQWPRTPDPRSRIPPKVKAAFTRAYNKEGFMAPYGTDLVVRKSRATGRTGTDEEAAEEAQMGASTDLVDDNDADEDDEDEKKELEALKKLCKTGKSTASSRTAAGSAPAKGKQRASGAATGSKRGARKAKGDV